MMRRIPIMWYCSRKTPLSHSSHVGLGMFTIVIFFGLMWANALDTRSLVCVVVGRRASFFLRWGVGREEEAKKGNPKMLCWMLMLQWWDEERGRSGQKGRLIHGENRPLNNSSYPASICSPSAATGPNPWLFERDQLFFTPLILCFWPLCWSADCRSVLKRSSRSGLQG